tara:strand:+ start:791 stop:1198 length:408 start_codon:yes stop_codon:yes gene_type:complete
MITWLAVQTALKKAWAWCKKYWQILVGASIPLVIWFLSRDSGKLDEVLEKSKESHAKELEAIEKSHKLELEKRDEAIKRYQETMAQVEDMYRTSSKELTKTKRKAVEKAIKDNKEDPDAITRKLAELTGFEIHVD